MRNRHHTAPTNTKHGTSVVAFAFFGFSSKFTLATFTNDNEIAADRAVRIECQSSQLNSIGI